MSKTVRSGLGVSGLYVVAACFAAAALLRAGDVAASLAAAEAESPAQETSETLAAMDSEQGKAMAGQDDMMPATAGEPGMSAGTPKALLEAIQARTATLDKREKRVMERERALEVAKQRIAVEMAKLMEEHAALTALVEEARGAAAEGTQHLVKIYRTMKPKKAGAIFNEMDPRVAVEFLREMNGEAASFIIANMDTKKAYAVTLLMAGRKISRQTQ